MAAARSREDEAMSIGLPVKKTNELYQVVVEIQSIQVYTKNQCIQTQSMFFCNAAYLPTQQCHLHLHTCHYIVTAFYLR